MLINYVQKGKLNLAEPYKMKPACEGGFLFLDMYRLYWKILKLKLLKESNFCTIML